MIQVAISDDDITVGKAGKLLELHRFHEQFGIPVSYFIIPFPRTEELSISQDTDLQRALDTIRADGSEAHPHSHRHHPFEWGYPEIIGAMEFSEGLCKAFADHRFSIELYHDKDRMLQRMVEVVEEWKKFSGEESVGFRPGWGSFSCTFYEVLKECGYKWSSTRFASRASWHRSKGYPSEDVINPHVGLNPYLQNGLIEFPILGDFGFHAKRSDGPELVALFKKQFWECLEANAPAVICHHPHGLDSDDVDPGSGYEIYSEIFEWLIARGDVEFVTMSKLYDTWKDKDLSERLPAFDGTDLFIDY